MSYAGLNEWPEPPVAENESATLLGSLGRQRATFAWKVGGLDETALQATVKVSTVTLGGLLKHLAQVEDYHFCVRLMNREPSPPFDAVDWDAYPEWDWSSFALDEPTYRYELWQRSVDQSRRLTTEVLTNGGLDQLVAQNRKRE